MGIFVVHRIGMAFWEDVVFIGYLQTRIYGIIKNDILAVTTGGFVFALVHYPSLVVMNIVSGGDFGLGLWINLVLSTLIFIAMHTILNGIFRRFHSIIPVTLFHASFNLATSGDFWYNASLDGWINSTITYTITFSLVLLVCVVLPYLKNRK